MLRYRSVVGSSYGFDLKKIYLQQNEKKQLMPVHPTSVNDAGNIKEAKLSKGTCSMSLKEPNLPEKRAHLSEISENGHHEPETVTPSEPSPSSCLLENGRAKMQSKKAKDWRDLAQRLLFSETKSSSTGRQKCDHESEFEHGSENCSLHNKPPDNRAKLKFREGTSSTGSKGSINNSKDYILFSPTRMAAAKKRSGFQQQKLRHGNLSASILTPPPGLDLSSLCSSPTDAGKMILHSTPLKGLAYPSQNPLCPVASCHVRCHLYSKNNPQQFCNILGH